MVDCCIISKYFLLLQITKQQKVSCMTFSPLFRFFSVENNPQKWISWIKEYEYVQSSW